MLNLFAGAMLAQNLDTTTDEIYDAIRRIDPGAEISKSQVHQAMLDAGYQYRVRPGSNGIDFRWMLQAR